jgi:hypothetical protein
VSILKVVEAGGHGSFYALIGVSLAALLYPLYNWLLPFVSSGLVSGVDSGILLLAATSVISGLLYAVPLDRLIDHVIEYKGGHDSRHGLLHYVPVRALNAELLQFIVRVDYLVSAWRAPYWLSSEDSCRHALSSAVKDPSIKKEIWSLKNRAGIGFAFLLWGLVIGRLGQDLYLVSVAAVLIGAILLLVPWMLSSSTRLPTTVRQVAAMRYAQDALTTWRALGREDGRSMPMSRLAADAKQAEVLISDSQWDRLSRLYEWTRSVLDRHGTTDYEIPERLYEIWARAVVQITEARNRRERIDTLQAKYMSALSIFGTCGAGHLPEWTEQMTPDDLSNLPKLLAQPTAWKDVDPYYATFHDILPALFATLGDERTKVSWLNSLVNVPFSKSLLETLFRFACQYTGDDIVASAYVMFAGKYELPYEEVTVAFIDRLVEVLEKPPSDRVGAQRIILNTLAWLAVRENVGKDLRERIVHHAERLENLRSSLQEQFGAEWRDRLRAVP